MNRIPGRRVPTDSVHKVHDGVPWNIAVELGMEVSKGFQDLQHDPHLGRTGVHQAMTPTQFAAVLTSLRRGDRIGVVKTGENNGTGELARSFSP